MPISSVSQEYSLGPRLAPLLLVDSSRPAQHEILERQKNRQSKNQILICNEKRTSSTCSEPDGEVHRLLVGVLAGLLPSHEGVC